MLIETFLEIDFKKIEFYNMLEKVGYFERKEKCYE